MFLFDTDHLSIFQRKQGDDFARLRTRILRQDPSDIFVSVITMHEQLQGWNAYLSKVKSESDRIIGYERLAKTLTDFKRSQLLLYTEAAVNIFSELKRKRIRVGTMDMRIASIAIATQMTLLTRNTVDFERIPNLKFEDWTVAIDG